MASQPPVTPPPAGPQPGNPMVTRAQRIIMTPAPEWDRIDAEPMTEKGIMTGWVAPLAAIGPVATLIGGQLFGIRILGATIKQSIGSALATAVIGWLLAMASAYVLALIIDALAPSFGATRNRVQALKVAAFSSTAAYLAGIFGLIPMLSILGLLGLYSLYLLWLGLPKLMKAPGDKALTYFIVTIVCAIVLNMLANAVITRMMPTPSVDIRTPTITISG